MSEYIKRSDAIIAVTRAKLPDTTPDGVPIANGKRSVTDCVRRIKEIPSAVVRCKDCKYGTRLVVDLAGKDGVVCCHGNINRALNWFCADGEANNE